MIEEPVAARVPIGGLGQDGRPVLERVQTLGRHRAVARATSDRDLDLHPTPLAAVDPQCSLHRVTGAFRQHDGIGDELGRCAGQEMADDVPRTTAVVVLLGCSGV